MKLLKLPFEFLFKVGEKVTYEDYKKQKKKNKKIARKLKSLSGKEWEQKDKIQRLQDDIRKKGAELKNLSEENSRLRMRVKNLEGENIELKSKIKAMKDGGGL
jgi:predicted nuclease with TOPRIM domain